MEVTSKVAAEEYLSSLMDLTINSKPLINMLTILADEYAAHAPAIVKVIEEHIEKVSPEVKLPILYLVDSIVKNVGPVYVPIFSNNIVNIFASAFQKVDERTRVQLFKVRQTWNDIFPARKLLALDVRIQHIDPNWPVTTNNIHLNPKFLAGQTSSKQEPTTASTTVASAPPSIPNTSDINNQLLKQKQILMELQKKKEELEMFQKQVTEAAMAETVLAEKSTKPLLNEEAAKILSLKAQLKPKGVVLPEVTATQPTKVSQVPPLTRTKIAPANSQLIEAAKSRDPRLARQMLKERANSLFNDKPLQSDSATKNVELCYKPSDPKIREAETAKAKEEEILSRQMAMLKAPVIEQDMNSKKSRKRPEERKRSSSKSPKISKVGDSRLRAETNSNSKGSGKDTSKQSPTKSRKKFHESKDTGGGFDEKTRWESSDPSEGLTAKSVIKFPKSDKKRLSDRKKTDGFVKKQIITPEPPSPPRIGSTPQEVPISSLSYDPCGKDVIMEDAPNAGKRIPFIKRMPRGRNYSRRNKELSPSPPPPSNNISGVDAALKSEAVDMNKSSVVPEEFVEVAGKDIDFRQLSMNTATKRLSVENLDDRPAKKSNVNDIMELFGNKDTDERLIIPQAPPSPPPPPVISIAAPPTSSPVKLPPIPKISQRVQELSVEKPASPKIAIEPAVELENKSTTPPLKLGNLEDKLETIPFNDAGDVDWRRASKPETLSSDGDNNINFDAVLTNTHMQYARGAISRQQYHDVMEQVRSKNASRHVFRRRETEGTSRSPKSNPGYVAKLSEQQKIRDARRRFSHHENSPIENLRKPFGNDQGRINRRGGLQKSHNELPYQRRPRNSNWQAKYELNRPEWLDHDSRSQDVASDPELESVIELPSADPVELEKIAADVTKSIMIDGTYRDIRFYEEHAVVILSSSQAFEITFENGIRTVFLAGLKIECQLNGPAQAFLFKNSAHSIKLGAPTREVSIDGKFYEVQFGGQKIDVDIDGASVPLGLSGPPPQVRILNQSRPFCHGFVQLIVDAEWMFPLYLDTKPQKFLIQNKPIIVRIANLFTSILINEVPVDLKFGGDPKPVRISGRIYFLRLSSLPDWVVPSKTKVVDMTKSESSESEETILCDVSVTKEQEDAVNSLQTPKGPLDIFTSLVGTRTEPQEKTGFSYEVENHQNNTIDEKPPAEKPSAPSTNLSPVNLNINDLLQSLMKTGLIAAQNNKTAPVAAAVSESKPEIKPIDVDLRDSNSLKVSQPGLISMLYSGIQCGSCGVRFAPEETRKYSQHLDWHFRQNRRERDAARRGASRRWYYEVSDWIQFEEIEDLEERAQSWFEVESLAVDDSGTAAASANSDVPRRASGNLPSVSAPPGNVPVTCALCQDRFDTFYHEETEDWHLKNCVLMDSTYYHPDCYEDLRKKSDEVLLPRRLPLLADLIIDDLSPKKELRKEEEEEAIIVDDTIIEADDGDIQIMSDAELLESAKDEIVKELVVQIVEDSIIEAEERMRKRMEEEELEVLAVKNKNEDKPPVDVIEVHDDGEIFYPQPEEPVVFDPNRKIKAEPFEMETAVSSVDQTLASIVSSIDGNVELNSSTPSAPPSTGPSKIKITFNKTVAPPQIESPRPPDISVMDTSEIEEVDPPPILMRPKKSRIAEREMRDYPPIQKGSDLSGLCTIM